MKSLRLQYQALRDYCLFSEAPSILENYMELVIQFGYIILFGQIFPLGALFSYFSNEIQIYSQVDNLIYMRRPMPEVADNIGHWMGALETLSNLSVATNAILLYYTHKRFKVTLTYDEDGT